MKKIIVIAVAVVLLSQAPACLNRIYPDGGFLAASRRTKSLPWLQPKAKRSAECCVLRFCLVWKVRPRPR